ncbi:MAG: winged helix-turn-helix transcriptional regulator [Candidatus Dormibacteria bacterium]
MADPPLAACPMTTGLEIIGGEWQPIVLYALAQKPRRFSEFQRPALGVGHRVLVLAVVTSRPRDCSSVTSAPVGRLRSCTRCLRSCDRSWTPSPRGATGASQVTPLRKWLEGCPSGWNSTGARRPSTAGLGDRGTTPSGAAATSPRPSVDHVEPSSADRGGPDPFA